MNDCVAIQLRRLLPLGRCPRCGAVLQISNERINDEPMVCCPNDYSIPRIKKLVDRGELTACGFLWYAPWSNAVRNLKPTS